MKLEVTLTSDEYAALCKAPGRSAPQRMRWLVRFFQAVCEEREREKAEATTPEQDRKQIENISGINSVMRGEVHPVAVLANGNSVTPCERLQSVSMNDGYGAKVAP